MLGRGGFAEVWSAFDIRLKREVAVKTLRYDIVLSENLLQRFEREAEAVAKLRHPNIIPIYEVGEGSGLAYFVMPMIEGESLGEALDREGRFSIGEASRILRETAGALAAAHRAGIVHRDIKPDNIMLEGPERRPIVMDFGIAKATSGGDAHLTGTGMAMGTPHYMSPEQASGEKDLGAASDQYALALVGYRMLAGQLPFHAETMPTLIMKQITEVPKPLNQVRSDVPRELSDALARALSKDPAARYGSMSEFGAAIPQIGGATDGASSGRRRPTATELARFPGAQMPAWREPVVLSGIIGFLLSIGLYSVIGPRAAITTASKKGDALFAGRAFLTKQGASGSYDERMRLIHDDSTYVWLQRAVGTAEADRRALSDVPTYLWNLRWQRGVSGGPDEVWNAAIAPGGQIVRFGEAVPDTAPGARLTSDSAVSIAAGFLREVGADVATLTRIQDSVVPRAKRTDHLFAWEARSRAIRGAGADTAIPRIRLTVAGDRVQDFRSSLQLPKAYLQTLKTGAIRTTVVVVVVLVWTALVIAAIVLAVQRQRSDELQWKAAARLSGAAIVFSAIALYQNPGGLHGDSIAGLVLGFVILGGLALAGLVFGVVSGESLANERNPPGLVGLESTATLKTGSPEWAAATARGFAIAGILAGAYTIGQWIAMLTLWRGAGIADGIDGLMPWSLPASELGGGLVVAILIFFSVHFIARYTGRAWAAILLPGLLVGAMGIDPTLRPWIHAVETGLVFSVLCWTVWRYGFLTAVIAYWASEVFGSTLAFVAIGAEPYLTAAGVSIAALLALPAIVFISRKRATPG